MSSVRGPGHGIGIVLLIYLLAWGKVTAHVRSWIRVGGFQFQPSEFMKIFTALMLAKFFDSNDRAYLNFRSFVIAMLFIALLAGRWRTATRGAAAMPGTAARRVAITARTASRRGTGAA